MRPSPCTSRFTFNYQMTLCWCVISTGPAPANLLATVVKGGKTRTNGKTGYTGSIRHSDPLQCPHGALGRMLVSRFTVSGEVFPHPADKQRWHNAVLWCGNNPQQSITYSGHFAALSRWLGISAIVSTKVTHLFKVAGARQLDEAGMDDQVRSAASSCMRAWRLRIITVCVTVPVYCVAANCT